MGEKKEKSIFATRVLKLCKEREMTQKELCEAISLVPGYENYHINTLYSYMKSGAKQPKYEVMELYAKVLDCDVQYLMGGDYINVTDKEIKERLGFSDTTIEYFKNNKDAFILLQPFNLFSKEGVLDATLSSSINNVVENYQECLTNLLLLLETGHVIVPGDGYKSFVKNGTLERSCLEFALLLYNNIVSVKKMDKPQYDNIYSFALHFTEDRIKRLESQLSFYEDCNE